MFDPSPANTMAAGRPIEQDRPWTSASSATATWTMARRLNASPPASRARPRRAERVARLARSGRPPARREHHGARRADRRRHPGLADIVAGTSTTSRGRHRGTGHRPMMHPRRALVGRAARTGTSAWTRVAAAIAAGGVHRRVRHRARRRRLAPGGIEPHAPTGSGWTGAWPTAPFRPRLVRDSQVVVGEGLTRIEWVNRLS